MKIIAKDNFDRDTRSDRLVASGVSIREGIVITEALNERCSGPDAPIYYKMVADDYKLFEVDY